MVDDPNELTPRDPASRSRRETGKRETPRVDLEREVSLTFKEFRGFIHEMSSNISTGGMFLRSSSPKPRGAIFDFEIELQDETPLVQGIGKVVWTREEAAGPDLPAGMGVRFLALSSDSEELIEQVVGERLAAGEPVFDPAMAPESPIPERTAETLQRDTADEASGGPGSSASSQYSSAPDDARDRPASSSPAPSEPETTTSETTSKRGRTSPSRASGAASRGRDQRPPLFFVLLLLLIAALVVAAVFLF